MTKSNEFPQEPNAPIFLEEILITHINGHRLPEPCAAQVVLHLSPKIVLLIESESFPIGIVGHTEESFVVKVKDKRDIQVILYRRSMSGFSNGTAKGAFCLYKSPITVIPADARIDSICFSVLNFPEFFGQQDKWINPNQYTIRLGQTKLVHNNLQIRLTQAASFPAQKKYLDQTDGYGITHTGVIQHCDGKPFSVEEAEDILRGLRAFLSFSRGAECGLVRVKAVDPEGGQSFLEWGTTHTDSWRCGNDTWLPTRPDGGENLSRAFSGFWSLYSCPDWKDVLLRTIDWYLNSKNGPFHIGIILIQTALESLCCEIVGPKKKGEPMGKFLSESIKKIGLCTAIPSSCSNLDDFFQNCPCVGRDGPKAIVALRNDLVHAKKKYGDNAEVQIDALRLGQWYIEMILLKKLGYVGRYRNRVSDSGKGSVEDVPWKV